MLSTRRVGTGFTVDTNPRIEEESFDDNYWRRWGIYERRRKKDHQEFYQERVI